MLKDYNELRKIDVTPTAISETESLTFLTINALIFYMKTGQN